MGIMCRTNSLVSVLAFILATFTNAEGGTYEVLHANNQGRPTAVAGNVGSAGLYSTQADDEAFRNSVKEELTLLLRDQVGGDWLMADSNMRDLEAKGKSKVSKNGNAHIRFIHQVNGYPVDGASLVAHTDAGGEIFLVNGEFLDGAPVPMEPLLDAQTATSIAMEEAGISQTNPIIQNMMGTQNEADLAMVRDENDNVCFAWKSLVEYTAIGEDGNQKQTTAFLYANTQDGHLCGLHPQTYELGPDIRTYSCASRAFFTIFASINRRDCSNLYSDSIAVIETEEEALDAAHNNALATYRYYKDYHGIESLDDNGMPLISYVLEPDFKYENAFWDGRSMTYGDGNPPPRGSTYAFSLSSDVVAHEFTHGVITSSSNLVYRDEPGALNEAMADIFGIQVKRMQKGGSGTNLWWIGEEILADGRGIRDMSDPEARGHYDYYPTRYRGSDDYGGVHWNSGIANLAFYLFVTGGSHPRNKTDVEVKGLIEILGDEDKAFEVAGDIFFCSAWSCLTSWSTFDDMRMCSTDACGMTGRSQDDEIVASMKAAWDAVGVRSNILER